VFGLLALAFLLVPIVEIYLIIQVGSAIGGWETVGLLIVISLAGACLVRHQGIAILARVQRSLAEGRLPTDPLIDGLLVLIAGALMLTPGFLTDGVGLLLLLPPSRIVVRSSLKKRFAGRVSVGGGAYGGARWTNITVYDTDGTVRPPDRPDEPPSNPIELGPGDD
jgi:UPF0716 protein FxsA